MVVATSTVTSQGQISVPAEVRKALGIRAGAQLVWSRNENGDFVIRPKRRTLDDLPMLVGEVSVRLSDGEIREARREFMASRAARSGKKG